MAFMHLFILIILSLLALTDDTRVKFVAEPESSIWIEGRTTVNDFQCEAADFEGVGMLDQGQNIGDRFTAIKNDNLSLRAKIPVNGFECGKRRMNRDLYNALKGDDHPHIIFDFIEATTPADDGEYMFNVIGKLTVAGVTQRITFAVNGYQHSEGYWRAVGKTEISMKDFDVDLPSPMLGMIRVSDRMTVNFDLFIEKNNAFITSDHHE